MIYKKQPTETLLWIVRKRIETRGSDPVDFAEYTTYDDTKTIAYRLGVKYRNRKKVDLWRDILKTIQHIDGSL